MTNTKNPHTTRGLDGLGVVLLLALAAIAVGSGMAAVYFRLCSPSELAVGLFIGSAFVVVGLGVHPVQTPKNTNVHGAAKPASEREAHAAARGDTKAPMHDQTFAD